MNDHRQLFHLDPCDAQTKKLRFIIHKVVIGRFLEKLKKGYHGLSESAVGRVI
jgi:hypothetical protein